jgi:hypothetical protein
MSGFSRMAMVESQRFMPDRRDTDLVLGLARFLDKACSQPLRRSSSPGLVTTTLASCRSLIVKPDITLVTRKYQILLKPPKQ